MSLEKLWLRLLCKKGLTDKMTKSVAYLLDSAGLRRAALAAQALVFVRLLRTSDPNLSSISLTFSASKANESSVREKWDESLKSSLTDQEHVVLLTKERLFLVKILCSCS